jgi:transcriptional regulator with XRE-family HTH domain
MEIRSMEIGSKLRSWRKSNVVKQQVIASRLGVSQTAVSRWENGLETPSPAIMGQLRTIMAKSLQDDFLVDRLFIERQSSIRALFDIDGARLLCSSAGFQSLWPQFALFHGRMMMNALVDESRELYLDADFLKSAIRGEVLVVSGVSDSHTDIEVDQAHRHRWITAYRNIGSRRVIDMSFEACDPTALKGIHEICRVDDF